MGFKKTGNKIRNVGNSSHLKIIQNVPEQHSCIARRRKTTKKSQTGRTCLEEKKTKVNIFLHMPGQALGAARG